MEVRSLGIQFTDLCQQERTGQNLIILTEQFLFAFIILCIPLGSFLHFFSLLDEVFAKKCLCILSAFYSYTFLTKTAYTTQNSYDAFYLMVKEILGE